MTACYGLWLLFLNYLVRGIFFNPSYIEILIKRYYGQIIFLSNGELIRIIKVKFVFLYISYNIY